MIKYTKHSEEMLKLRSIDKKKVSTTIKNPDHKQKGRNNKLIYLKDFGKNYLKVVLTEEDKDLVVITQYWLSKEKFKGK